MTAAPGSPLPDIGVLLSVASTAANGGWDTMFTSGSTTEGKLWFFRPGATAPAFEAPLAAPPWGAGWNPTGSQLAVVELRTGAARLLLFAPPGGARPDTPFSGAAGEYVGINPTRVLDTREGLGGPARPLGAGETLDVQITGIGQIPTNGVSSVAVNITGIAPTLDTYLSVFPTSGTIPFVSNLNVTRETTRPNLAIVRVGAGGRLTVYNAAGATNVVLDVQGYFSTRQGPAGGRFHSLPPTRLLDTRETSALGPDGTVLLPVAGRGGIPTGATALAMTVIGIAEDNATYLTAHPSDAPRPHASNINARRGETASNLVYTRVGADGAVALYNAAGSTHVVVDVVGYWDGDRSTEAGRYVPYAQPFRLFDTRDFDVALPPRSVIPFPLAGIPAEGAIVPLPQDGGSTVVYNLTATNNPVAGYLTAWPGVSGPTPPHASTVNFGPGQTVAILAMSGYGNDGVVNVYNPVGDTDIILDLAGFFTSSSF